MTDVKISDLILHTVEQKPIDFKDTFDTLLKDRLASAVETKRTEIAKSLFNNSSDSEEVDDVEQEDEHQEQEYETGSEEEYNG